MFCFALCFSPGETTNTWKRPQTPFKMDPEQGRKLRSYETERRSTRDRLRGGPGEGGTFSTLTRYLLSVELRLWGWLSRSVLETGRCAQDLTCTSTPHPAKSPESLSEGILNPCFYLKRPGENTGPGAEKGQQQAAGGQSPGHFSISCLLI